MVQKGRMKASDEEEEREREGEGVIKQQGVKVKRRRNISFTNQPQLMF